MGTRVSGSLDGSDDGEWMDDVTSTRFHHGLKLPSRHQLLTISLEAGSYGEAKRKWGKIAGELTC